MYAYIPSPFGGRLPSYALAKANKPEPEASAPKRDEAGGTSSAASDSSPFVSEFGPEFDEDDDRELKAIQTDRPNELDDVKNGILQNKQRMWDHDYYVMGSKGHPERNATIERVRNDPRHPHREEATRLWGASNPAPPAPSAQAPAPAPESPKPEAPEAEEAPSPSPAPETPKVQTESHEQEPSEPKEESGVPTKWPKNDSRYDWETVYNKYSGLTPAQQESIDEMFDDVEGPEDVKAAVSRIAQFSGVPYLTMSSDPKMLKLISQDPTVARIVQQNRDRAAKIRAEKGDDAKDRLSSPNIDLSHAEGQGTKTYIPLENLREGKNGVYGAMPVADAQKRQKTADETSKEFEELQRNEIRSLNEIKNYPGNPGRVNVALNARGQTKYGGKLGEDYGETSIYSSRTEDDGEGGTREVNTFRYDGPSVSLGDTGLSFGQRMRDDGMGLEGVLFNTASGKVVNYDDLSDVVKEKLGPAEHGMVPTNNEMYSGPNRQHLLRDAWGYFGDKEELASRNPAIVTKEKEPEPEITDIGSGLSFGNGVNKETGKPERKFYLNGEKRPLEEEDVGKLTPEQQALITYHRKYPDGPKGRMYRLKSEDGEERLLRSNGYVEDKYMGAKPSNKPRFVGGAFFMPVLDREGREVAMVPVDPDKYKLPREKRTKTKEYRMAPTGKKERFELFPEEHETVNKSATMTMRDMQMPSISDMIHDRRLRSAPYPSVTPLGRALP